MESLNLRGKVAAILNMRELAINIGANAGVKTDMIFRLLGEAVLKDPDTDIELGTVQHEKGKLKVVKVEEKFAIARTFETYRVNIGGVGTFGTTNVFGKLFAPPEWVTRVKTLKYEQSGLEVPEQDANSILVKVGDIVELIEEIEKE